MPDVSSLLAICHLHQSPISALGTTHQVTPSHDLSEGGVKTKQELEGNLLAKEIAPLASTPEAFILFLAL